MRKLLNVILAVLIFDFPALAQAGAAVFQGAVHGGGEPLIGATVSLPGVRLGTTTGPDGRFILAEVPAGEHLVRLSYVGYRTLEQWVVFQAGENRRMEFSMQEDVLGLEAVVVSATRNTVPMHQAPVIINRIGDRVFERTQSLSLSEGLSFSPGLRLENNCQNCGFTQLRMNGLDGPYTQILINSRPIFSALAGVYGLEMIPANMIDRVEVVRGGGSVLYGGNAIAGTVNIITKDPLKNTFAISTNHAITNLEAPDRTTAINGAIVSENLDKGVSFYAYNRSRAPWDANGDGFSEMTKIENMTFGLDFFYNLDGFSKIKLHLFSISEFRRGGNKFDLPPHQTDVTEQLGHRILSGALSYERFSKDYRHKYAIYASAQQTARESYYGGGGRILTPQDSLTEADILALNAYGQSQDIALAAGFQYSFDLNPRWMLTAGNEYQYNEVLDQMPGYEREIDQKVGTLGTYAQLQWKPTDRWSLLAGGRFDRIRIDGLYSMAAERLDNRRQFNVLVPRLTAMYNVQPDFKLRFSFAQGYRAPQAFDEDLHIQTVGGAALFTRLAPGLQTERSNSFNASLDYTYRQGPFESNFVLDGFYTRLDNPFITAEQVSLPSGVAVLTKRNGAGAAVAGLNAEANLAFSSNFTFQLGATIQSARYDEDEEIWTPLDLSDANQDSIIAAKNMLRTPRAYGFFTANWRPVKRFDLSLSGIYTGSMDVPHVIEPQTAYTIIRMTPQFFELNLKLAYKFRLSDQSDIQLFAGVQNILNSFQRDFDFGAERDAGYIYGPSRPRTIFGGAKFSFE
jgi:outer membrane receptor for ferrienterochelin and colicins